MTSRRSRKETHEVTHVKNNDGGYYAIKGFEFQIDKTILEILNCEDENRNIALEQIQDINTDSFVIQVKYKETQNFAPSKITEPIIELIDEFLQNIHHDCQKKYYLYCYFKNKKEEHCDINLRYLNIILGSNHSNYTDKDKDTFLSKFKLIFSESFQQQFHQIISKLRNIFSISNDDEAVFYYANIAAFLRRLITANEDKKHRVCTKKQIIHYLKEGRKLIFDSFYKEYKGEKEYYNFVKSKFKKPIKCDDNFIILGNVATTTSLSIEKLVVEFVNHYYKKATHNIKPITLIVPNDKVREIKESLIKNEILFNDGYEHIKFSDKIFFESPIINKQSKKNGLSNDNLDKISFKLRVLSKDEFEKIQKITIQPDVVYYFDTPELDILNNISFIKIDGLTTKQILDIFNS